MLIYLAAISSDEDKSKFELIYRQYRNLMYYAANQILHNSSDAEDVVHQAFLKIVEILDTISEIKSHKTRSLIVTITERKAIDLYRSKSRTAVLPLDETYIGSVAANEIEHMAESDAMPRQSLLCLRVTAKCCFCATTTAFLILKFPKHWI